MCFTVGVVAVNLLRSSWWKVTSVCFFLKKSSDRLSRCVVVGGTCSLCGSPEMPVIPFLSPLPSLSRHYSPPESHKLETGLVYGSHVCVCCDCVCLLSRMWAGYDPLAGYFGVFLYIFATCELELLFV